MKQNILSLVLMGALVPAALEAATGTEQHILKVIDDVCGDTWCEGSFAYQFDRLEISAREKQAELFFRMSTDTPLQFSVPSEKPTEAQVISQTFAVSCRIQGVSEPKEMLTGEHSLRWDVYMSLNDCISALEGRFYRILRP